MTISYSWPVNSPIPPSWNAKPSPQRPSPVHRDQSRSEILSASCPTAMAGRQRLYLSALCEKGTARVEDASLQLNRRGGIEACC